LLFMSFDSGFKDPFRDEFNLSVKFINNYISKKTKALNLNTVEEFNTIHIEPILENKEENVKKTGEKVIKISLHFNKNLYESLNQVDKIEYCLILLNKGIEKLFKTDNTTLFKLNNIFLTFKKENYINHWLHKRKIFKTEKLEVILNCEFSSINFILKLLVINTSNKEILLNDILIKTLPDEVCFSNLFKDVLILNDQLIITEFQNRPKFIFKLEDIYKKEFKYEVTTIGVFYSRLD